MKSIDMYMSQCSFWIYLMNNFIVLIMGTCYTSSVSMLITIHGVIANVILLLLIHNLECSTWLLHFIYSTMLILSLRWATKIYNRNLILPKSSLEFRNMLCSLIVPIRLCEQYHVIVLYFLLWIVMTIDVTITQ